MKEWTMKNALFVLLLSFWSVGTCLAAEDHHGEDLSDKDFTGKSMIEWLEFLRMHADTNQFSQREFEERELQRSNSEGCEL